MYFNFLTLLSYYPQVCDFVPLHRFSKSMDSFDDTSVKVEKLLSGAVGIPVVLHGYIEHWNSRKWTPQYLAAHKDLIHSDVIFRVGEQNVRKKKEASNSGGLSTIDVTAALKFCIIPILLVIRLTSRSKNAFLLALNLDYSALGNGQLLHKSFIPGLLPLYSEPVQRRCKSICSAAQYLLGLCWLQAYAGTVWWQLLSRWLNHQPLKEHCLFTHDHRANLIFVFIKLKVFIRKWEGYV